MSTPRFQTLLAQFQARYPLGCLCSDLLTIHQGLYVVRAMVQSGNLTVATAMAAAPEIEAAEDRAKVRVLEMLRLDGLVGSTLSSAASSATSSAAPSSPNSFLANLTSSIEPVAQQPRLDLPEPPAEPELTEAAVPPLAWEKSAPIESPAEALMPPVPRFADLEPSEPATDSFEHTALEHLDLEPQPLETLPAPAMKSPAVKQALETTAEKPRSPKAEKSAKRKTETFDIPPVSAAPARDLSDRSEEIMKIGIEMKRLGWSTEQGREYLKRTYGKRSRQELDEAELLDFLRYLETQPSPMQTPF